MELIPAGPAVSKELEGNWGGLLKMGNGAFPMVFHFKNQPDKTVRAIFDSATPLAGHSRVCKVGARSAGSGTDQLLLALPAATFSDDFCVLNV